MSVRSYRVIVKPCLVLMAMAALLAGGCSSKDKQQSQGDRPGDSASQPSAGTPAAGTPSRLRIEYVEVEPAAPEAIVGVFTSDDSILVEGSGDGQVGPITFDQPYYIVTAKYQSADPYSMLQVMYKRTVSGTEMDDFLVNVGKGGQVMRVFSADKPGTPKQVTFQVKAKGSYTIEFAKPPDLAAARPAPLTVKGGKGYAMTPLVKTSGNYVMLAMKYTGPVDPSKKGGMPLATAVLYDAQTGDVQVRDQNAFNGKTESQDGKTRDKPGTYFAIVGCHKDDGAWEATIKE